MASSPPEADARGAEPRVDSASVGDPACFRTLAELERGLAALPRAVGPGRLAFVVRRGEAGLRERLAGVRLSPEQGAAGDPIERV
jgi:hypothetical protein